MCSFDLREADLQVQDSSYFSLEGPSWTSLLLDLLVPEEVPQDEVPSVPSEIPLGFPGVVGLDSLRLLNLDPFRDTDLYSLLGSDYVSQSSLVPCESFIYLFFMRTGYIRPRPRTLFISLRCPTRGISRNAVSYFSRSLISSARDLGGDEVLFPKALSIRALATSVAFMRSWSLARVLEASLEVPVSVFGLLSSEMSLHPWGHSLFRAYCRLRTGGVA